MRPSQPGRVGSQSLAALVSRSRVTKAVSVRSMTQRWCGLAADQGVDHRPRDWRRFQHAPRRGVIVADLERPPQQLIGRHAVGSRPHSDGVGDEVERPQPGMPGPAPHRRLVEACGKTLRRHRGQNTDIAGPSDAEEVAAVAAHVGEFGVMAEALERPIERPHQPRLAVFFAGERGAAPLHRSVEEPHAGELERRRDVGDLRHIGRAGALEPIARQPVERRHKRQRGAGEKAQARIAQGPRLGSAAHGVQRRPAVADVRHGNRRQGARKSGSLAHRLVARGDGSVIVAPASRRQARSSQPRYFPLALRPFSAQMR